MPLTKTCDDCGKQRSNVGPWRDAQGKRQICGPCKARIWASGDGPAKLKQEIEAVCAQVHAEEGVDDEPL